METRSISDLSEFTDIPDFGGLYLINRTGSIYSIKSRKLLKASLNEYGYETVSLVKNKVRGRYKVHTLVARTYIPNPEHKESVDHINRNRADNCVENLRWASPKEQVLNSDWEKGQIKATEAAKKAVLQIDKDTGIIIGRYDSSIDAALKVFHNYKKNSLINRCAHGKCKTAYGYRWIFVEKREDYVKRRSGLTNVVYRYINPETDETVYVGKAKRQPARRFAEHRKDERFTKYEKLDIFITEMPTIEDMDECEKYLINKYNPKINVIKNKSNKKYNRLNWDFYKTEKYVM